MAQVLARRDRQTADHAESGISPRPRCARRSLLTHHRAVTEVLSLEERDRPCAARPAGGGSAQPRLAWTTSGR
jgi:hypothetical protein